MTTSQRRTASPRVARAIAAVVALILGLFSVAFTAAPAYAVGDVQGRLVNQLGTPILGLDIDIWSSSSGTLVSTLTSDATTGTFQLTGLADGTYYYWVHEGAQDAAGDSYGLRSETFFITGGVTDLTDLVIKKYVDVTGTITNWTPAMGNVTVQFKEKTGGSWSTVTTTASSGASFTVSAPVDAAAYTFYFQLPSTSTAPFLDAYLGGEYFDPNSAATVTGVAGTPISGVTMAMPAAAFIRGTVTDKTTHAGIPGIWVSAEDRPATQSYAETQTDSNGDYELRVYPGLTYAVYADDFDNGLYVSMTYDGLDGCGCTYTPVPVSYASPATNIDFDLTPQAAAIYIEGIVLDGALGTGSPYDGVRVHLYKPFTGGWKQVSVVQSDNSGNFEVLLPALGSYRLRFEKAGVWMRVIDGFAGEGSAPGPSPISGCTVDTGTLDAGSVVSSVAYFAVAGLNTAGGCHAEPIVSGGGGGGGGTVSGPPRTTRTGGTGGTGVTLPTPSATPTPEATPASSPTPSESPSTSPSPEPSSSATPAPAGYVFDFGPFLLIIVLVLVGLLIVVGVIVAVVRRR